MRERPAKSADVMTFSLYLCLLAIGWSMLFSVGYNGGYKDGISSFLLNTQAGKQTIWVVISLIVFFFTQIIDRKFWQTFAYPIYGFSLISLVLVLIIGKEIKGATSWFAFGGFSIQPSEFAKFATCLATAAYLSGINVNLKYINTQAISFGLILAPAALILLQPDAGSALIFFSFLLLFYREGFPGNYYILGFSVAACFIFGIMYEGSLGNVIWGIFMLGALGVALNFKNKVYSIAGFLIFAMISWLTLGRVYFPVFLLINLLILVIAVLYLVSKKTNVRSAVLSLMAIGVASFLIFISAFSFSFLARHQRDRINVWLNPEKCDPLGSLYNLIKSKSAIASGGLQGQGFLNGNMTQLNWVPEQSTDFIFSAIGEEQGFIGSLSIILFFLLLLWRITVIAERQRSAFVRCYAYGVVGILFVHFIVNIGMTMGLMPVIGIPLPFISKGGSSLLGFSLMIGVLLKMDRHRTET
ncbi:MAG: rod shape determining protein RodA [Saprospiraceae bacterium]|jgi:rod shape determining protein RodA